MPDLGKAWQAWRSLSEVYPIENWRRESLSQGKLVIVMAIGEVLSKRSDA